MTDDQRPGIILGVRPMTYVQRPRLIMDRKTTMTRDQRRTMTVGQRSEQGGRLEEKVQTT